MNRPERLALWNDTLAPYAVPFDGSKGRVTAEPADETRFAFQRDRDRIIHTQAFRRLQGKTQVFVAGEGDHYRTRLTHTMEVAQISRDMARTLRLNEDLTECIALAHDLGHPPFGHAGEEALDQWMQKAGKRFEHNQQSYRIVTVLEPHTSFYRGLNLNREVLYGLLKHTSAHDKPGKAPEGFATSVEAQIVNVADEIAYTGHDVEDGLRAKLFTMGDLKDIDLITDAQSLAHTRETRISGSIIHLLVSDIYEQCMQTLAHCHSIADVEGATQPLVRFSPDMLPKLRALRKFLWDQMYQHPRVRSKAEEGQKIITALCTFLAQSPTPKVKEFQEIMHSDLTDAVKDYVAGMTDTYARQQALEHRLM